MHKPTKPSPSPPPSSDDSSTYASACPYKPCEHRKSTVSKLNPLNYMPSLPNRRESSSQTVHLPVDREPSTIPKGDGDGNWEYPSPQQMYNALLRKGYTDTPQDAIESMVAVHNFLNEGAWQEILDWESRFSAGLFEGWRRCSSGPLQGSSSGSWDTLLRPEEEEKESRHNVPPPALVRFMGRPGDLTPKARMLQVAGWMWPAKYSSDPPFDRHDWYVRRHLPDGSTREVRYVIDYYSGPPEPTGEPVFYLDVRPAVDGPTAAVERIMKWGGDVWYRGSGGAAREEREREKQEEDGRS